MLRTEVKQLLPIQNHKWALGTGSRNQKQILSRSVQGIKNTVSGYHRDRHIVAVTTREPDANDKTERKTPRRGY
jgi:hypothetical protein